MAGILIVEDDINIRKLISVNLKQRGYSVSEAGDGDEAMSLFRGQAYDLAILDLILPGFSGVDLCIWIRIHSDIPIIVLSGIRDEDLKVMALDAGADDYVTKPFGHNELMARVRAMLRRAAPQAIEKSRENLSIGALNMDFQNQRVQIDGQDVSLTKVEYALLVELAIHADTVVNHDDLLSQVWGTQHRNTDPYLHIYLGRIRKKLGKHARLLETIPGIGYRLQASGSSAPL